MDLKDMEGYKYILRTREYLDYMEEHLDNVRKAFFELTKACDGMTWVGDDYTWWNLHKEVLEHDVSKFTRYEFTQYRDYFFGDKKGPIIKQNFSFAWDHHKSNNHHHWETLRNESDIVHMLVDWTAMSYKFKDTPWEYYENNLDTIKLNEEQEEFLMILIDKLKVYRAIEEKHERSALTSLILGVIAWFKK